MWAWHKPAALVLLACGGLAAADELAIERLTWAGVKLIGGDTTVFIDAVGTDIWEGDAPGGFVPVDASTSRRYALVTHAHNDHFDPAGLTRVLGERGYLVIHESIATYAASRGLQVIPAAMYEPIRRGGFIFTAVPASDGFGAEQVSWVVTYGQRRLFHGGDTLWHGKLDLIGAQYGPFDAAFLPINGARQQSSPASETPGTMTPEQAVDAAVLLRSRRLVPIHYGLNDPPGYVEVHEPLAAVLEAAARRGVGVIQLRPGEHIASF